MTAPSRVRDAALGVRSHSWAAYIVLAGDAQTPDIVARGRMVLCDAAIEAPRSPSIRPSPWHSPRRSHSLAELKSILASHALIHTAEGAFYREAIAAACAARRIAVHRVRERELDGECEVLAVSLAAARQRFAQFGRQLGAPWTQDEKLSALGAWLTLASLPARPSRR